MNFNHGRWQKLALKHKKSQQGISIIEVLIVVAIIGLIMIALLWWLSPQLSRGRDAKRKADLQEIKVAFEDYYNDNNCYPPPDTLENCKSSEFRPYLDTVPCDPGTGAPYAYVPEGDICSGYRLLTGLEDDSDPAIEELGCDSACGCGFGEEYNYGVSSGVTVTQDACTPIVVATPTPAPTATPTPAATPTPTPSSPPGPTPTPLEGEYTCDPAGICNFTYYPIPPNCPVSFLEFDCQSQCGNPANRCQ